MNLPLSAFVPPHILLAMLAEPELREAAATTPMASSPIRERRAIFASLPKHSDGVVRTATWEDPNLSAPWSELARCIESRTNS
jgi:hypothetical protein